MRIWSAIILLAAFTASGQKQYQGFYLARTTGKLNMLATGLGEDRLGGAKMGYIDTSVLLRIVDSSKEMYRVQLSERHHAYISKADVRPDTVIQLKPFYLTSTVSIRGDDRFDFINISLEEKLPFKSWMETAPSKICIDLYGVQNNTNWITLMKSAKEVKHVVVDQVEDDVVRVTIELVHRQHWGYSVNYHNKVLSVRVRRQPRNLKLNRLFVAIDAGHGGTNNGAEGITSKVLEKNYTIRFANELEKRLKEKGAHVVMTRTGDTTFNNIDRVLMLQNEMPDLLISLHLNSSGNRQVNGVSTYYKHVGYKSFSSSLLNRMLQLNLSEFGNIGNFNFTLNAPTDFPGALVEIAFLSNAEDEKKILDSRFQKAVAKKIYKGIRDWLRLVRKSA
jgi:N-acetylmuramoyl-L-alanine amidase